MTPFPILTVPLGAGNVRRVEEMEQMGTKPKFWLVDRRTGLRVLWKEARPLTGEDWSEKVAHHIARRLGIPCPLVHLAMLGAKHGVLCWDFLRHSKAGGVYWSTLVHGNELMLEQDPVYPAQQGYRVKQHTVSAVCKALEPHGLAPLSDATEKDVPLRDAFDSFVGYLLLDALLGNTDRHHENWGIESAPEGSAHVWVLAPSYDHASSLGRELSDKKRKGRMDTSGQGTIAGYAQKARSAFWAEDGSRTLSPCEALVSAGSLRPRAFAFWRGRLQSTPIEDLCFFVERVPAVRLSDLGKGFARALLAHNYERMLHLHL